MSYWYAKLKGVPMRPGECRYTKFGVKYCYIPGKGVRFVKKERW